MSGDDFVEVMDFYRDSIVEAATQKRPRHLSQNYESGIHVKIEDALPDIYPDVDMTTAISMAPRQDHGGSDTTTKTFRQETHASESRMAIERLDLVPSLYTYTVRTSMMPIRSVQSELITLYFSHIHPMFPVVDEHHFFALHQEFRGREEFMDPADFLIYNAIMAASFSHLTEPQLHRTPYRSVSDGQEALFDQIKARYQARTTIDPLVLTQVALIISLWSPGAPNPSYQNNSGWLDTAFRHANTAKLWSLQADDTATQNRYRLLCWCCIVRDRHLAIVMRRPYRLHKAPLELDMITAEDFGLESTEPSFSDLPSKRIAMLAFIWLCKLSETMAGIAVFQQQVKFSKDWNGTTDSSSDLEEVYKFDRQLEKWNADFEKSLSDLLGDSKRSYSTPVVFLRIISSSLFAGLYQPYINISELDLTPTPENRTDPLERVKLASEQVAINIKEVMDNQATDAVPGWMYGYFILPATVYYVSVRLNPDLPPETVFMSFLKRLARRLSSAQIITSILSKTVKELSEQMDQMGFDEASPEADTPRPAGSPPTRKSEARLLANVSKIIDNVLEYSGVAPGDSNSRRVV